MTHANPVQRINGQSLKTSVTYIENVWKILISPARDTSLLDSDTSEILIFYIILNLGSRNDHNFPLQNLSIYTFKKSNVLLHTSTYLTVNLPSSPNPGNIM